MFGPAYPKIHTVYQRDDRGVIVPGVLSRPEFGYLADLPWRWTEKVDGTNVRLHWDGSQVVIGGRTDKAQVPATLFRALGDQRDPDLWRQAFDADCTDVTVYGEGFGDGIQKRGVRYRPDQSVIVFDVRVGDLWLEPDDVVDVAEKLGLEVVPLAAVLPVHDAVKLVENRDIPSAWANVEPEGLVGTPAFELHNRRGERIITKIKVKDFDDLARRGPADG